MSKNNILIRFGTKCRECIKNQGCNMSSDIQIMVYCKKSPNPDQVQSDAKSH